METDTAKQPVTYIYALIDPREPDDIKGVRYIGKATGSPLGRYREHISCARHGTRTHCYNWIRNLLGIGLVPTQRILEIVPRENGGEAERRWIRSLREQGAPLTNLTDGGEGSPGYKPSVETCRKISVLQTGKKFSVEHRARMSAANMGNKNGLGNKSHLGYHQSEETCAKMSAAKIGKKFSSETRTRMSAASLGNKNALGCRHSDETKRKMSAARRAYWAIQKGQRVNADI